LETALSALRPFLASHRPAAGMPTNIAARRRHHQCERPSRLCIRRQTVCVLTVRLQHILGLAMWRRRWRLRLRRDDILLVWRDLPPCAGIPLHRKRTQKAGPEQHQLKRGVECGGHAAGQWNAGECAHSPNSRCFHHGLEVRSYSSAR
jgi:hypothetical protein